MRTIIVLLLWLAPGASAMASGAYLGAELGPVTPQVSAAISADFPGGAIVIAAVPKSPAAAAGLKADDVVLAIDGRTLNTPEELVAAIGAHSPGDRVRLSVVDIAHGYTNRTVSVRLAARPAHMAMAAPAPRAQRGARWSAPHASPSAGTALIPLEPLASGLCRTFAPNGWSVIDQNPQGTVFTLASPDRGMMASYAGTGVNGGAAQGWYGPQGRTPEAFALYATGVMMNEPAQMTGGEKAFGRYRVLDFVSASHQGYVLLYTFPLMADPAGYGIIMRIAAGRRGDTHSVGVAGSVAAAARCQSALVPPSGGYAQVEPRSGRDDHGTGRSSSCNSAQNCDDSDLAGTYNAQLGTGYVHSETGENFLVDPSSDYHATGPDGPGYYRQSGNSLEKLQPGWSN